MTFLEGRDRTDVAGLGNPDLRAFFGQLCARNQAGEITKATVAAYDRSVRAFCSFCVQEKLLLENPMKGRPRARAPRGLPDTLTFAEIHALLNACNEDPLGRRDRALMLFMLDTGLRAGEVCALTAADLFLAGGDLETLRRLLGHASLETVRIYLGFRTEEVEACHIKFSPVRQLMARS